MKIRTDIHAGRAEWQREMVKCLEDRSDLYQKIDALESRLNAPAAVVSGYQSAYGTYPVPSGAPVGTYPNWNGYYAY